MAREIAREQGFGFQGLNKALTSTLMRHGIWNMVYFGFYHNIKNVLPEYQVSLLLPLLNLITYKVFGQILPVTQFVGFFSGTNFLLENNIKFSVENQRKEIMTRGTLI